MGILYQTSFGVFLVLLCCLGGGAAWMTDVPVPTPGGRFMCCSGSCFC